MSFGPEIFAAYTKKRVLITAGVGGKMARNVCWGTMSLEDQHHQFWPAISYELEKKRERGQLVCTTLLLILSLPSLGSVKRENSSECSGPRGVEVADEDGLAWTRDLPLRAAKAAVHSEHVCDTPLTDIIYNIDMAKTHTHKKEKRCKQV